MLRSGAITLSGRIYDGRDADDLVLLSAGGRVVGVIAKGGRDQVVRTS